MARPKEYVGTGEELAPYLKQHPRQRFRLIPLDEDTMGKLEGFEEPEKATAEETPQQEKTLAEMFAGRVGRVSFDPPDVSTRAEEYFGKIVAERHSKRRKNR